ncbi:hypothetical protein L596_004249 [Steinernema carpocapsae]|uniref:Uncharacterized protein n=1 Tax=Steinernema carpocapsae TaxID=34508 RepID=A0A4U8UW84_STECR|nr:hypothetical protein L596_004249 [Steinernema carpocapsae]
MRRVQSSPIRKHPPTFAVGSQLPACSGVRLQPADIIPFVSAARLHCPHHMALLVRLHRSRLTLKSIKFTSNANCPFCLFCGLFAD